MTQPLSRKHVAVLMGGLSPEREVSLVSGAACADALERLGARVSRVDAGRDIAEVLTRLKPDVCFNALHGEWGEDGCVQGVLETLGLPYSHCGVLASALAMDKAKSKAVLAAAGCVVPGGGLYNRLEAARDHVMAPPYVVKPNAQGSSVGVFLVFEGANTPPQELSSPTWNWGEEVMIEPYIAARSWPWRSWTAARLPSPRSSRAPASTTTTPSTPTADRSTSFPRPCPLRRSTALSGWPKQPMPLLVAKG